MGDDNLYEGLFSPCPGVFVDTEEFTAVYIVDDEGEVVCWICDEIKEDPSAWTASLNAVALAAKQGPAAVRRSIRGPIR